MQTIKGPAIFLAQFLADQPPYNSLEEISAWVSALGYKAVQIPTWDKRCFDLDLAAESRTYCEDIQGVLSKHNLVISEISTHLQGQLVAVHPAYDLQFDTFAPKIHQGNKLDRTDWAISQVKKAATASYNLGLRSVATFSGALLWPMMYPWPARPAGVIEVGFEELAKRWLPILQFYEEKGVNLCYELHPGEDLHDGITFERFLEAVGNHSRAQILYDPSHFLLQQIDYLSFIDHYHERIKMFHVKDAEFNPNGKSGVYGGYQGWIDRPGRFRSLGDGQINFKSIFSKFAQYNFSGWAVLEWECCLKSSLQGATEGAKFIQEHIIEVTEKAFDDFAGTIQDHDYPYKILGLQ